MELSNRRKILMFLFFVMIFMFCLPLFLFSRGTYSNSNSSQVHFISLGASNSFLIESNGHYGLIDSGNPYDLYSKYGSSLPSNCVKYDYSVNNVYKKVVPYLESLGVEKLDFVIATHAHSDHIGGITKLVELGYITSDTVYYYKTFQKVKTDDSGVNGEPSTWCTNWVYTTTMNVVNEVYQNNSQNLCDVTTRINKDNGSYQTKQPVCGGKEFSGTFTFYDYQIKFFNTESTENAINENTNSLGILLTYGTGENVIKTFLSNDIDNTDLDEYNLVKKDINNELKDVSLFLVGHHGYVDSNTYMFLKHLNPEYTVISNSTDIRNTYNSFRGPYTYLKTINNREIYLTASNNNSIVAVMGEELTFKSGIINNGNISYNSELVNFDYPTSYNGWYFWTLSNEYITSSGKSSDSYMYFDSNGDYVTGFQKIDGNTFYFDENGVTVSGFQQIDGNTYYFATLDDKLDDTDNVQGSMLKGWHELRDSEKNYNKSWYYFNSSGHMVTGYVEINDKYYYLSSDGKMLNGVQNVDSKLYYFDLEDGNRLEYNGLKTIDSKTYYFNDDYSLLTGWYQLEDGTKYYFDTTDGHLVKQVDSNQDVADDDSNQEDNTNNDNQNDDTDDNSNDNQNNNDNIDDDHNLNNDQDLNINIDNSSDDQNIVNNPSTGSRYILLVVFVGIIMFIMIVNYLKKFNIND